MQGETVGLTLFSYVWYHWSRHNLTLKNRSWLACTHNDVFITRSIGLLGILCVLGQVASDTGSSHQGTTRRGYSVSSDTRTLNRCGRDE